tara:strand:- start:9590 stop:10192 length:603 start_codon:yes stop_codon:yes gene_type:complete
MKSVLKLVLPLFAIFMLASCQSDQEKLILNHEQTLGETKIDLSMSVEELEFVGTITGSDSINILITDAFGSPITTDSIQRMVTMLDSTMADWASYGVKYDSLFYSESSKSYADMNMELIDIYTKARIDAEKGRLKVELLLLEVSNVQTKVNNYGSTPDKVLGNKWSCVYTIKNPLLGNAEQTITKTYVFSPDNKSILTEE